jgi:hypothetical protein
MGKGGSAKIEVVRYHMAQHFGICTGPVDAITRITVKEKVAWEGEVTTQSQIRIEKDQLFGGREKEGGVEAIVYWLPGADDQVLDDHLAQRLGKSTGAEVPGYRGVASAFFVGAKGTGQANFAGGTSARYGAYWSANNPYLPGVWITVRRAPVGLDPDFALIPNAGSSEEISWTDVGTVDLDGINDAGTDDADGLSRGVTLSGFDPTEIVRVTMEATGTYTAWSFRLGEPGRWLAQFRVIPDGVAANAFWVVGDANPPGTTGYIDAATAKAAFNEAFFSGGSSYTFFIKDNPYTDNTGGLSIHVEKGTPGGLYADANPAHIIYESLTNTDWGMGSPTAAIDTASFEAAGVTLYVEGFGLSMIWTRQSSIQDFIQEVLDHINAVLFVDPATGLLTMKLVRGDYEVVTLPELTPDNADLTSFNRKQWGEITNEVIVSWTNPATEQEETAPPAQDLASIAMQGLVSDSRNYYGVRNANLAQQLAWRELRSSGTPLATFEAEVDRRMWQLRPASVVKVTWPEYGLAGVVARVTSIDYGRPGDPTIKLSLIEDVFGLDMGDYVEPPSSGWVDPSEDPEALTIERIFTLPLFFAANSPAAEFVTDPVYPEVVAGILATTDQEDAYGYDLWDEVTLSNGSLEWQEIAADLNIIGHAELTSEIPAEAETVDVEFTNLIGDTIPTLAGFVIIGDGEESEVEIAQVDAIDEVYELYVLRRGVLDTVPRTWPAGTPVWFVDQETIFEDPTIRAAGETMDVKLLTRTSQGVLDLASAALVSHELTERPWLPNRPADVQVEGVSFNTVNTPVDMTARPDPWVTISWVNRNRLTEDAQVLAWDDATVTPETGQTTRVIVYAEDGTTVLATHDSISGISFDVPDASFGSEGIVLIKPWGKRTDADGTFVSLQAHGIWVQVGDTRITEDGVARITEDGERRALED